MLINTFWKIVIKSIGLWLLINTAWIILQLLTAFSMFDTGIEWYNFLLMFGAFLFYLVIVFLFLFKTSSIVNILKLDKNFKEERIDMNLPATTILSIVVCLIGAIWFLKSFPALISSIIDFFKQPTLFKDYTNISWLVFHLISSLAGFYIMTNSRLISNYLWHKNNTNTDDA